MKTICSMSALQSNPYLTPTLNFQITLALPTRLQLATLPSTMVRIYSFPMIRLELNFNAQANGLLPPASTQPTSSSRSTAMLKSSCSQRALGGFSGRFSTMFRKNIGIMSNRNWKVDPEVKQGTQWYFCLSSL